MARLRDPERGCAWDVVQDFRSIAPHTIEEAYEVADAIEAGDLDALRDELGDLLLQVVYHARMAEELGRFAFDDVARGLADKLVRRHPHVFGDAVLESAAERERAWEGEKAAERARKGKEDASVLAGVTRGLPALTRAQKLQRRAARIGFDWPDAGGARAKIDEELEEIDAAGDDPDSLAAALDEPAWIEAARETASFLLDTMRDAEGRLLHRYREGEAAVRATADEATVIERLRARERHGGEPHRGGEREGADERRGVAIEAQGGDEAAARAVAASPSGWASLWNAANACTDSPLRFM